jgi:hypothetical protein
MILPSREYFPQMLNALGLRHTGVEVGVHEGDFAFHIAQQWLGWPLYLVDRWRHVVGYNDSANVSDEAFNRMFVRVANRMRNIYDVGLLRMDSTLAAGLFADETLDWVYIDADHSYDAVMADLHAWYPKVRKGGLVAGHDFLNLPDGGPITCHVKFAVEHFMASRRLPILSTNEDWPTWYVFK